VLSHNLITIIFAMGGLAMSAVVLNFLSSEPSKNKPWQSPSRLGIDHFCTCWPSQSANRSDHASGMDGTASLANRESGRKLRAKCRKVAFSGAVKRLNDTAVVGYFGDSRGRSAETGTRWRRRVDSNSR
jgi:hypothetical protein